MHFLSKALCIHARKLKAKQAEEKKSIQQPPGAGPQLWVTALRGDQGLRAWWTEYVRPATGESPCVYVCVCVHI